MAESKRIVGEEGQVRSGKKPQVLEGALIIRSCAPKKNSPSWIGREGRKVRRGTRGKTIVSIGVRCKKVKKGGKVWGPAGEQGGGDDGRKGI